ncbi:MAG TPA: thiosulfate oxidation carrier complex protein SoxZ [Ramlibacter sp.]|nr:thiosulfate oxidation carrier complex protein SoxZ [Ramlibacter sp.]
MARTLVNVPPGARRGDIVEIRATIAHTMETGFRPGADGRVLPRDIIRSFTCRYNGADVFSAELYSAIAANPYIAFHLRAADSGTLEFTWSGDNGFTQTERVAFNVA